MVQESFDDFVTLGLKTNKNERLQRSTEGTQVDLGVITRDDAALFQLAHASKRRRWRQPSFLGQRPIGLTSVSLEFVDEKQVGG